MFKYCFLLITWALAFNSFAQKDYALSLVDTLCSDYFAGRGYVDNGVNKSADFIASELKNLGVLKFPGQKDYFQEYNFDVNAFPFPIEVKLGDSLLIPGRDYILNANSGDVNGTFKTFEITPEIFKKLVEKQTIFSGMKNNAKENIYIFDFTKTENKDSLSLGYSAFVNASTYANCVWIEKTKMTYAVGRKKDPNAGIIILEEKYFPTKEITLNIKSEFTEFKNKNVIGYIPGKNTKKYIFFTAHYDHLGKMGQAIFPGANDNASGTAMLLSVAKHYAKNQPNYSLVFCFFSGEEAGLEGSKHFVYYPILNLKKIKMVINIDIMGSAENGITVVNASEHKKQFDKLLKINTEKNYLPEIKRRGPTANSDHYYFTKFGVPAFFIYSMGNVKNYHDIDDTFENTPLNNFDEVQNLFIDFVEKL